MFEYDNDLHMCYTIYASDEDSSWTEKEEDEKVGEYNLFKENIVN